MRTSMQAFLMTLIISFFFNCNAFAQEIPTTSPNNQIKDWVAQQLSSNNTPANIIIRNRKNGQSIGVQKKTASMKAKPVQLKNTQQQTQLRKKATKVDKAFMEKAKKLKKKKSAKKIPVLSFD